MSVSASVVDRHPAGRGASVDVRDAGTATRALARVEARRLLVHPAVLTMCGVLVLFFWMQPLVTGSVDRFPVLHQVDAEQHIAMLLLGVGVMIAANLAVLRSHRHNADVFFTVTVLPPWRRTLAHLLALLPVTAVAGIIELAGFALLAVQPGAVGRPDPLILAAGPLLVTLFGACGVLLARLIRSAVVAPLAVALVVFFWLFASLDRLPYRLAKLSPTFTGDTPLGEPQVPELLGRPAAAHLAYLLALVVLVAAVALLRTGGPRTSAAVVALIATMATLAAGTVQSAGPSAELTARRAAAEDRPSSLQQCRTRGTVTYCAFPTFAPRMEQWNEVVTGVRRHVPPARAAAPFTVRQRAATLRSVSTSWSSASWGTASLPSWQADDRQAGTPDPISVGTQWGPDSGAFPVEFPFAVHVAYRFVTGSSPREETNLICGAAGAVLVWLAGQATPQTREEAREHAAYTVNRTESFRSATLGPSVDVGRREADLAYALLQQPTEQVAAALTASWADLTARATTVEQAAKIFGVNAAAPLAKVPAGEESTIGDCG